MRKRTPVIIAIVGLLVAGLITATVRSQSQTPSSWRRTGAVIDGRNENPWKALLGNENSFEEQMANLSDPKNSDLVSSDALAVAVVARDVVVADNTGQDRDRFVAYFPPRQPGSAPLVFCTDVSVQGVGTASSTAGPNWAQALVYWSGSCPAQGPNAAGQVRLHLHRTASGWQPVRDVLIPGQIAAESTATTPPDLVTFSSCGAVTNQDFRDRRALVVAFESMCRAAKRDGMSLKIASAYRTPEQQQEVWDRAVDVYGTEDEAAKWVAYSDGVICESRHCTGDAVSLVWTKSVANWLNATVGCIAPGGTVRLSTSACEDGERVVRRGHKYGFAAPLDAQPWYLELAIPLPGDSSCGSGSAAASVPSSIASTFRCQVGYEAGNDPERVAGEALVVARCSSGFNPSARVNGGQFAESPDPETGQIDDRAGLFAMTDAQVQSFVAGGLSRRFNAGAAADGAARLYLAEVRAGRNGWGPFACAGALPGTGEPLPDWATSYAQT